MNLLVSLSLILQINDVYLYYLKNNAYFWILKLLSLNDRLYRIEIGEKS